MENIKEKLNKSEEEDISGGYYNDYNPYAPHIGLTLKGNSGKKEVISKIKVLSCDLCGAINSTVKPTKVSDPTVTDLHICQNFQTAGRHKELERKYGKVDFICE